MITQPKTVFIKNPLFISYTSLSDFLACPKAYYLKNIYRDSKTGFRLQVASPYLSLGSTVHDAIKWFLEMRGQVTQKQLADKFRNLWLKYRGKRGGFASPEEEANFGKRGLKMLDNFFQNAQVLEKTTHQLDFPKLSLGEEIILMGNFDFVGEKEDGTLHVLDFKTGISEEKDPIQLYIYAILAEANLQKEVTSASFWYLDKDTLPKAIVLDPLEPKLDWLKEKSKLLKQAITDNNWVCKNGDELCKECKIYTALINGDGEFQFSDGRYKKDVYFLANLA